jgi:hypothetical protein
MLGILRPQKQGFRMTGLELVVSQKLIKLKHANVAQKLCSGGHFQGQ